MKANDKQQQIRDILITSDVVSKESLRESGFGNRTIEVSVKRLVDMGLVYIRKEGRNVFYCRDITRINEYIKSEMKELRYTKTDGIINFRFPECMPMKVNVILWVALNTAEAQADPNRKEFSFRILDIARTMGVSRDYVGRIIKDLKNYFAKTTKKNNVRYTFKLEKLTADFPISDQSNTLMQGLATDFNLQYAKE
jgi:DNA-binding transcriptional ArsR family regulator